MTSLLRTCVGATVIAVALAACGGTTVVDPGGGGNGGSSSTSSSGGSTSSSSSTSSGTVGCSETKACPPNAVCIWSTGECAEVCGGQGSCDSCPTGQYCNDCATGSCPGCEDCVAACVDAQPGQCDDHTDCEPDEVCLFGEGQCAPTCDSADCADPNLVCADCVTSSGPCLADCVAACVAL